MAPAISSPAVAAEFDTSNTVTIQGTITRVEWMNPHARIWVDAKNGDAALSSWELELPAPNAMLRHDTTGVPKSAVRDFLKQGEPVTVTLWRAKNGSLLGNALTMTLPDGRVLNFPQWGVS